MWYPATNNLWAFLITYSLNAGDAVLPDISTKTNKKTKDNPKLIKIFCK